MQKHFRKKGAIFYHQIYSDSSYIISRECIFEDILQNSEKWITSLKVVLNLTRKPEKDAS